MSHPPMLSCDISTSQAALQVLGAALDFNHSGLPDTTDPEEAFSALRGFLTHRIAQIIEHEFWRLPQLLYKIDVSEKQVEEAFKNSTHETLPNILAELILRRLLRTLKTRREYSVSAAEGGYYDDEA